MSVEPTLVHLTLRNNDYKRALDFIFESGSSKLARMTRPDALDEEMKLLEDTGHAALKWTVRSQIRTLRLLGPTELLSLRSSPDLTGRMNCSRSSAKRSFAKTARRSRSHRLAVGERYPCRCSVAAAA